MSVWHYVFYFLLLQPLVLSPRTGHSVPLVKSNLKLVLQARTASLRSRATYMQCDWVYPGPTTRSLYKLDYGGASAQISTKVYFNHNQQFPPKF